MLKIFKKNILFSDPFVAKTPREVQVGIYRHHHATLIIHDIHGRRQNRRANPEIFTSNSSRDSPSRIASGADDDDSPDEASRPNTKQAATASATAATHLLAKNHTSLATQAAHKAAKHAPPNSTIISTPPSSPRQNEGVVNSQTTSSSNSTVTSVETGLENPDTIPKSMYQSRPGMPSSTLYTIIGTGALAILILGLCIWACWSSKRRGERRLPIWRMITNGAKPKKSGISYFEEARFENSRSTDAEILKGIHQGCLRGDSPRKKALGDTRDSELWGSGKRFYGPRLANEILYNEKHIEKSLYENLEFEPVPTRGASYPPIANYSEAEGVNEIGADGGHNTQLAYLASKDYLGDILDRESNIHIKNAEPKMNTIAGLKNAYGNLDVWNDVEHKFWDFPVDHAPRGVIQLQSDLPKQSFSNSNYHNTNSSYAAVTENVSVSLPTRVVKSSASSVFPQPTRNTYVQPDLTTIKPLMSPSEASKELEYVLSRLGKDLPTESSPAQGGNLHDGLSSGPLALDDSSSYFSDGALLPVLPYLERFSRDPGPPSEKQRVIGDIPPELIEALEHEVGPRAQSCDGANYTGQIVQLASVTPETLAVYSEFWPSMEDTQQTRSGNESLRFPSFTPLVSRNSAPALLASESAQASTAFTSIFQFLDIPGLALPRYPPPIPADNSRINLKSHREPTRGVRATETSSNGIPQDADYASQEDNGTDHSKT